mgnify:CR=1 FL=1|tara:strand:+ start:9355 stop:10185 length:831 start_codon:yes stop_codon:yes gene_type:complete
MQQKEFSTNGNPCLLNIEVLTNSPENIRLIVSDSEHKFTKYVDRKRIVDGLETFRIGLPIAPKKVIIKVANEVEKGVYSYDGFRVEDVYSSSLPTKKYCINYSNKYISKFLPFIQKFCARAGYLEAGGETYYDPSRTFKIKYFNELRARSGRVLTTPARVHARTGQMEISADYFRKYTIPMRIAVMLHEFSHFYVNEDIDNEIEADLNGLSLYLSMGYPRISAFNSFIGVFQNAPTPLNAERYAVLEQFIAKFEKGDFSKLQYKGIKINALSNQCK